MAKHQSIKPAVDTDYKLTFSKVKKEMFKKQQLSTKILSFWKYNNYNTPTRAISNL